MCRLFFVHLGYFEDKTRCFGCKKNDLQRLYAVPESWFEDFNQVIFFGSQESPSPVPLSYWICSTCNWTIPDSCFKKDSPNPLLLLALGWQSAPLFFWWILLSVTPVSFVSRLRGIILKITMSGLDFQNSPQQHQIFYVTLSLWTSRSNWQSTWIISEVSAPTHLPVYFPILLVILPLVRAVGYTREYFIFLSYVSQF